MGALGIERRQEIERRVDRAKHRRRQRRRIDQASATIDQVIAQRRRAGDIGAEAAKGLGEGADDEVRLVGEATAALAQNAGRMGIVDDEHGVVLAREPADCRERRDIAIHGEHALGQDEFRAVYRLDIDSEARRDGRHRHGDSGSRARLKRRSRNAGSNG